MKATITIISKKYPATVIPYDTIEEADKAFTSVLKATNEVFAKDQVEREIVLEAANGKPYRSAKVAGEN